MALTVLLGKVAASASQTFFSGISQNFTKIFGRFFVKQFWGATAIAFYAIIVVESFLGNICELNLIFIVVLLR